MLAAPRAFVLDNARGEAAIDEALSQSYSVTEERAVAGSGERRRTWLDTFDWRLYGAGLVLEYEQTRRGGRLILTGADGLPVAEQPVTAWRPSRPAPLPDGPVADRIGSLISPRALLSIASATSSRRVFRLLNGDGKTVARVLADRTTARGADLDLRLQVSEVRGYAAQARRAATLLATVASPATEPVFTAATANGRPPGGYTGKVDARITAAMPARLAVATLLSSLLDTLEQNLDGVLRDIDTEFLHDLRVAVRRTRSALKLLGDVLPADLVAHYKTEFKWLGDLTTPVRDLDVYLLGFGDLTQGLLAASAADLEPFREFLVRRRAVEFRRLTAGLRSARFRALTHDWRKALDELTHDGRGAAALTEPGAGRKRRGNQGEPTRALAGERTASAVRQLIRRGAAITAQSPAESLHDLRKRGKELRYLLEFFAPIYDPAEYRAVLSDMKKLQDCLGEFQDSQVQREEITALARELLDDHARPPSRTQDTRSASRARSTLPVLRTESTQSASRAQSTRPDRGALAATLLAMGEINARLVLIQRRARADFGDRFARFASTTTQRHIQALLTQAPAVPR